MGPLRPCPDMSLFDELRSAAAQAWPTTHTRGGQYDQKTTDSSASSCRVWPTLLPASLRFVYDSFGRGPASRVHTSNSKQSLSVSNFFLSLGLMTMDNSGLDGADARNNSSKKGERAFGIDWNLVYRQSMGPLVMAFLVLEHDCQSQSLKPVESFWRRERMLVEEDAIWTNTPHPL